MHGQAIKRLIQDQARFAARSRSWLKDGAKGSIGFGGKLWILTTSDKSFKSEFSYCNLWCTLVCTSTFLTIGIWQCFDSEKNPALNLRVDMNLWNMPGCLRIWKPWISWCSPLKITIPPSWDNATISGPKPRILGCFQSLSYNFSVPSAEVMNPVPSKQCKASNLLAPKWMVSYQRNPTLRVDYSLSNPYPNPCWKHSARSTVVSSPKTDLFISLLFANHPVYVPRKPIHWREMLRACDEGGTAP